MTETVYRVPRSHWHCSLTNFEWDTVRPTELRADVDEFLAAVGTTQPGVPPPHLVLTGDPGIGKSHVGLGVYRRAAEMVGTINAVWLNVPDFCAKLKESYGEASPAVMWEEVEAATALVVLDDLFGRDLSMHEVGQILYRLIDTVYRNNVCLMVTANPNVQDWGSWLDKHELSRLLANATIDEMSAVGGDRRLA